MSKKELPPVEEREVEPGKCKLCHKDVYWIRTSISRKVVSLEKDGTAHSQRCEVMQELRYKKKI